MAHYKFKPCRIRWQTIQPLYTTLWNEFQYDHTHRNKPQFFKNGIAFLGGDNKSEYPFFKFVENEDSLLSEFKKRPLHQKPDIIFLSLESFRGWVGDFRIGKNCERMPNLCQLAKSGTSFPYTYSVGYPSTEGMLGLQLGIWSHPNKIFLSNLMNTRTRALPEILGDAGYYRMVLTAAEPSFDNFSPWFEKWFDYVEYDPTRTADVPLAQRFQELYRTTPKDKPLYFEWINFVTHTPFNVPESYQTPAKTSNDRYAQSVAYLDSAIGIILDAVKKGPRSNHTIFVVTGDHSIPNAKQTKKLNESGEASSAYTWTTFYWAGEGISKGEVIAYPVSHVDFAPTILSLLGIKASNHFVGNNLFEANQNHSKVFSFRHSDAVMRKDSIIVFAQRDNPTFSHIRFQSKIVDWDSSETIGGFVSEKRVPGNIQEHELYDDLLNAMDAWTWILDKNRLFPSTEPLPLQPVENDSVQTVHPEG